MALSEVTSLNEIPSRHIRTDTRHVRSAELMVAKDHSPAVILRSPLLKQPNIYLIPLPYKLMAAFFNEQRQCDHTLVWARTVTNSVNNWGDHECWSFAGFLPETKEKTLLKTAQNHWTIGLYLNWNQNMNKKSFLSTYLDDFQSCFYLIL